MRKISFGVYRSKLVKVNEVGGSTSKADDNFEFAEALCKIFWVQCTASLYKERFGSRKIRRKVNRWSIKA